MAELSFTVWGQAIPAPRARITRKGNYYPPRYEAWRALVQVAALQHGRPLWEGPVSLGIIVYGARKNADWDNIAKGISDSLEGIFYINDRQVREAHVFLVECPAKERRVDIVVSAFRNGGRE